MPGCACSVSGRWRPAACRRAIHRAWWSARIHRPYGRPAGLRVLQHLDALGTESGCHRLADGRVFTEEQGIARQGRDLAAQPGKGLRQLQRHHRRADYGKAFGNGVARQASVEVQ